MDMPAPTDYRDGPDLPSYLTLHELQTLSIFVMRFAIEDDLTDDQIVVGIHVRDLGPQSEIRASWIEFSVGERKLALWRNTLDLYEVGPDGAVGDEPIYRNDRTLDAG